MANYTPFVDGESSAADALNSRCTEINNLISQGYAFSGTIAPFVTSIPAGWFLCDGALLSRVDFDGLFEAIGTTFGSDSAETFRVPDLRGRVPLGAGQGVSLTNRVLGAVGGAEAHQLMTTQIPSHTHSHATGQLTAGNNGSAIVSFIGSSGTSGSAGLDVPHNNIQPSLVVTWAIKA